MQTLETPRLILRDFRLTDVDDLYAYAKDPSVGPAAGWKPHDNPQETLQILLGFIRDQDVWALQFKTTGRVVGSVGLHRDPFRRQDSSRMIGYVLSPVQWGQGLMPEAVRAVIRYAFDDLHMDLISIDHFPENDRSRRVIEKCGFTYEGRIRRCLRRHDGSLTDACVYSLMREEYEQIYRTDGGFQ